MLASTDPLPQEIKERILACIKAPEYVHPVSLNSAHRKEYYHTLYKITLLSKSWYYAANPLLWKYCVVDKLNIVGFVRGVLESVVCEDSRAELALERLQRVLPLTEKRIPKLLKRAKLMNLDVMDGIDRFGSKSDQPRQKCTKELKKSIDMVGLGVGPLVKKLWIPSWDDHLDILEFVFPYLINLKMIKFNHPSHDPDFIPTLRPSIINESQRLLERVKSVGVDDVDSEGWPVLIDSLTDHGQHLKILNLECCTEKDPFISGFGLSKMFSKMKDLECVRFDAAPIGSGEFGGDNDLVRLARTCLNLRAISIDYCDITINSFFTLWNECEHLDFLGFAGLQQATVMVYPELVMKPKLKTLRFVDVQANDQIMCNAIRNAPNLHTLRVVFEHPNAFPNYSPHTSLTDKTLQCLSSCKELQVLAISRSNGMTYKGFKPILKHCNIKKLDFHCTATMGSLDDYLMERISPVMKNVEVLNLFDQRGLTEQVLVNLVKDCSSLRSLCLNGCMVTVPLLSEMLLNPKITNLSIVDALQLTNQELDWFAEELEQMGHKIKIYSSLDVARRNVVKQDEWFLDMELDIFKMWDRACKKSI